MHIATGNAMKILLSHKAQKRTSLIIFLLPTLIFVFVFIAYPVLYSGYLSFTEFDYARDDAPAFIGASGYFDTIVDDTLFRTAFVNQVKFAIPYSVITFGISLGLAILVGELTRGVQVFQVVFSLPMIIALSMAGIAFSWMLNQDVGIINHFLRTVGLGSWARNWFGDPDTALNGLVVTRSWKMIGFTFIIFLSGVQSIPSSLREAARVDGAGFLGEVRHVVLPLLRPYLLAGGIWIIINSLKVFDLAHMVTQGGPGVATLTLYLYCWKAAFQRYDMGLASRVAYVTAFLILFLSWLLNRLLNPESSERF
jgi:ABC-type sugar transport system permease subunit